MYAVGVTAIKILLAVTMQERPQPPSMRNRMPVDKHMVPVKYEDSNAGLGLDLADCEDLRSVFDRHPTRRKGFLAPLVGSRSEA